MLEPTHLRCYGTSSFQPAPTIGQSGQWPPWQEPAVTCFELDTLSNIATSAHEICFYLYMHAKEDH